MNALELRRRTLGKGVYKKTVEGNPAIAQGSLARRYPGITMQGWTEQAQYEGNQLFDGVFTVDTVLDTNGETVPYSGRSTTDFIKVKQSTDYTGFTLYLQACYYDAGKVIISYDDADTVTRQTPEGCEYVRFNFINGSDVMFNEGSAALPYEPYTGGQPSPNPDYPQEIKNAGNYDEGTGKYEYQVKLTGKNLWNAEEAAETSKWVASTSQTGYSDFAIDVIPGQKVTVSFPEKLPDGILMYVAIVLKENGKIYKWLYYNTQASLIFQKQTVTALENKIWIRCNTGSIAQFVSGNPYFQIEYGEERTDFQPYKEQTVLLQSDRPLTKWDKLEKRNGVWGWVYKSAEKVLDGTEGYITLSGSYISDFSSNSYIVISDMVKDGRDNAFMNRLSNIDYSWTLVDAIGFSKKHNQLHVRISNADLGTTGESSSSEVTAAMKAYIAQQYEEGNPFVFWYETAEETFVPLSESEQEQMNELYTFRPTTVLSNDCECNMTLTYKTKKSLEVTD